MAKSNVNDRIDNINNNEMTNENLLSHNDLGKVVKTRQNDLLKLKPNLSVEMGQIISELNQDRKTRRNLPISKDSN